MRALVVAWVLVASCGAALARPGAKVAGLTVGCTPGGASVYVDGELVGQAPSASPIPVALGDHTLKVVKLGFVPFIDVFSVKGRKVMKVAVELVPVSGVLHVTATVPGARVSVDGRYVGNTPLDAEIDVGAHAVQVSKGGYRDLIAKVQAVAGQVERIDAALVDLPPDENPYVVRPLPPARWYHKKWVWGVVAAAAVTVAAGATAVALAARPGDPLAGADVQYNVTGR